MTATAVSALAVIACLLIAAVMWSAGYSPFRGGASTADDNSAAVRGTNRTPLSAESPSARPEGSGVPARSSTAREEAVSRALVLPANVEAALPREHVTLRILSGQLQRLNAGTLVLSLHIRFSNNGTQSFDRTYYTDLRLIVDGVPRAPTSAPLGQIERMSASEFDYAFEVPSTVTQAVLRVIRGDETSDIPLDFTAGRP